MGAVVYETGGLLIDHGWLRFLGSGHPKLPRSIPGWNNGRTIFSQGESAGFLLIADDVLGGFYALDGGALGSGPGHVCYFAPDSLCWEPMNGMGYGDLLAWSLGPSLCQFYEGMRWPGWESEVSSISGDQALSIYPPLWTAEGRDIAKDSRKLCPVAEVFALNFENSPRSPQPE